MICPYCNQQIENEAQREGGKKGGAAKTPAKRKASRLNGKKGGRPVKLTWSPWCKLHKPLGAVPIGDEYSDYECSHVDPDVGKCFSRAHWTQQEKKEP